MNFKQAIITFIIMISVTAIVLTVWLSGVKTSEPVNTVEKQYCESAFKYLPYDEFIKEVNYNKVDCITILNIK